jgi:formylmethanofuran dehydrogenase subunit C
MYKSATTIPVEAEIIMPDQLAGKSVAEIAALPVQHGNASVPLGEFSPWKGAPTTRTSSSKATAAGSSGSAPA